MAEEPGQPIKLPDSTAAPQVPEQLPGISFALTPEGRIGVADSGLATPDDIVQIQGLRDVLLAHLNDLEAAAACSNAFAAIGRNASSYRKILESPLDRLSIDKLFAYGLILDNANASLKAQIKTGDLPEAGIEVGAALDSVIAIHGTTVMSTGRGWELLQRLGVLDRTRQENLAYREKAVAFAESIQSAKQTFTAEARDIVVVANAQIEQGRHPERSSAIARQTNFNLISLALKIGGAIALPVIGQAFAATDAGLMGIHHLTPVLEQLMGFFVKNNEIIRGLIAASGQELSWAGSALDWLGQVARRSDETAEIYTESKQQVLTVAEAETEAKRLILADEKVPDHIAQLVKSLDFGGEQGLISTRRFSNLVNLQSLLLRDTVVSDVTPLAALANLQSLNLIGASVRDVTPLAALVNLQHLSLEDTGVSDVAPLAALVNLQTLVLEGSHVSDVTPLATLANLHYLSLRNTQVRDVTPLAALVNLRKLDLEGTQVSNVIPLAALVNLQRLVLWGTKIADFSPVLHVPDLQSDDVKERPL